MQNNLIEWKPVPLDSPLVNTRLDRMNGWQRATESLRYGFLCFEQWISPDGQLREWTRHNARVAAFLFIPAVTIMPIASLVLWQILGWLSMLTSILGRLVILPFLFLLVMLVTRISMALLKR